MICRLATQIAHVVDPMMQQQRPAHTADARHTQGCGRARAPTVGDIDTYRRKDDDRAGCSSTYALQVISCIYCTATHVHERGVRARLAWCSLRMRLGCTGRITVLNQMHAAHSCG